MVSFRATVNSSLTHPGGTEQGNQGEEGTHRRELTQEAWRNVRLVRLEASGGWNGGLQIPEGL